MNDERIKQIVDALNVTIHELGHWAFVDGCNRAQVERMRDTVLDGVKLIYEQENIIKALMGDYGDACDLSGCDKQGSKNNGNP